jgi:cell division protein FtsB
MRAWLAILALLVIAVVLGKATWNIYTKNSIALENKLAAVRELQDLENRQKIMADKLTRLKTPEGREEEIRKNLPMAKDGEYVITIVDEKDSKAGSATEATTTVKTSLWQRLFGGSN